MSDMRYVNLHINVPGMWGGDVNVPPWMIADIVEYFCFDVETDGAGIWWLDGQSNYGLQNEEMQAMLRTLRRLHIPYIAFDEGGCDEPILVIHDGYKAERYDASREGFVVLTQRKAEELGSYEEILGYFRLGNRQIPQLSTRGMDCTVPPRPGEER